MNKFRVQCYKGFDDFDDGDSFNEDFILKLPKDYNKKDVETMILAKNKDYRVVVVKVTEL